MHIHIQLYNSKFPNRPYTVADDRRTRGARVAMDGGTWGAGVAMEGRGVAVAMDGAEAGGLA